MFDKYTPYALNQMNSDSIICSNADGDYIHITRTDFATEEEFLFWKNWSDVEYQNEEQERRRYCNNTVALNEDIDSSGESPEDVLIAEINSAEEHRMRAEQMAQIRRILTKTQFRRLWKHHVMGMTEREIADSENVGQRRVSTSITDAEKKVKKLFENLSKEGAKNG